MTVVAAHDDLGPIEPGHVQSVGEGLLAEGRPVEGDEHVIGCHATPRTPSDK